MERNFVVTLFVIASVIAAQPATAQTSDARCVLADTEVVKPGQLPPVPPDPVLLQRKDKQVIDNRNHPGPNSITTAVAAVYIDENCNVVAVETLKGLLVREIKWVEPFSGGACGNPPNPRCFIQKIGGVPICVCS